VEPNWSLERVRKKKGKKLGVLPNTHSEREDALFLKSSKTPKSPALVFLACLFCILFCVVGLLRELGRQVGWLARSLARSRSLGFCAPNCWPKREKLSKPSSHSSIMCGILAVLGSYDKSAARRARILECSRRCVVFLLLLVLFLAVLFLSYLVFLLWSSFTACVFASFCWSMEKLQSNVVCVCVCYWTQREMCLVNDDAGWDTEGLTGVDFGLGMAEDVTLHMSAWPSLILRQATSRCSMRPKKSLLQWETTCLLFP
jgi:hypothetical protein